MPPLELWGGVECTHNRVGDRYLDQMDRSGHSRRASDLDLFAGLGIRALRYPVLWERTMPDGPRSLEWSWADERLRRLRELGIRPIVGLVHHGSGPRSTSLVDPSFASGLADFAARVAERYPWVDSYTPVNEPLTTARFSGLYGHWYPHGQSAQTFARCLVTQCTGIARAMAAIRAIVPGARLVQTEDLGRIFSTPRLAYQADFENHRRWLSFDLLCGRLNREHPMWPFLRAWDIGEEELDRFLESPCPPDVLGINHYITSDRFLDEDLVKYASSSHGGNDRESYADVEAVRTCRAYPVGTCAILREAWERYRLPLAVTEAQMSGTREEQMRWVEEIWSGSKGLREEGVDVRAVTVWALLGAFDWNKLVTIAGDYYEPGAFDVRAPTPRPTGLARLARELTTGARDPVLSGPGWWRRPGRLFPHVAEGGSPAREPASPRSSRTENRSTRPLLVVGGGGTLGKAAARLCDTRGISYHLMTRLELDVTNPAHVDRALGETRAWAVVNASGYVRVDEGEHDPRACFLANAVGPAVLAGACARHGIRLLTFSSDLVFDGAQREPYTEHDEVGPLNVYGHSKAAGEAFVLSVLPEALVVRTSAFFGPWDQANFVTRALRTLADGRELVAAKDAVVSPTYVVDLLHAALDLFLDGEQGVWHLANRGALSWAELASYAAELAGVRTGSVEPRPLAELGLRARRPRYSALASARGWPMPTLEDALTRYMNDRARG